MKLNLQATLLLIGFMAFSAFARQATTDKALPSGPPNKETMSYALGMNLGRQALKAGADLDIESFNQAVRDVMQGKPTRLGDAEVAEMLNKKQTNGLIKLAEQEKGKVSYALGMRMGMLLKIRSLDVDLKSLNQGVKDMVEGNPTRIQESEIESIFKQAQLYSQSSRAEKNKAEGEAFLAKNAKEPGIQVLPDGLQYRVLKTGMGEIPNTNDLLLVSYRGKFVNGTEFDHMDHFVTRSNGGLKGWQEALQRMTIGSKWEIVLPPALAYGSEGEAYKRIGGNATLIYELELISILKPGDPMLGRGRLGHGVNGPPPGLVASAQNTPVPNGQTNTAANEVSQPTTR